jgi:uncharacterized cupin superfamily protein
MVGRSRPVGQAVRLGRIAGMADPNLFQPEWELEDPESHRRGRAARLGGAAGARELAANLYELGPGGAVSPYHVHHGNEEMLIVLSGRPLLRTPAGTRRLEPGAVIAFPRGPEGAHRIANPDGEPARVLLLSTQNFPEVAEHLATGTTLTLTAPGEGKAFSEDHPFRERFARAMELDAEADQRGTSTS